MKNAGEGGLVARIRRMIMHLSQVWQYVILVVIPLPDAETLGGEVFL